MQQDSMAAFEMWRIIITAMLLAVVLLAVVVLVRRSNRKFSGARVDWPMPQYTPPGWYQDPSRPGVMRWWDGARWTEHLDGGGPIPGRAPHDPGPFRPIE